MRMLVIIALLLPLAACGKVATTMCDKYTDQVACEADANCHWNKNENACKS